MFTQRSKGIQAVFFFRKGSTGLEITHSIYLFIEIIAAKVPRISLL